MKPFFLDCSCIANAISGFVEAGRVPKQLYPEEPQEQLKEKGLLLKLTSCFAEIARLFAMLTFEGVTDRKNYHLDATHWSRQVCFCCN
jgi:hypothetical protein